MAFDRLAGEALERANIYRASADELIDAAAGALDTRKLGLEQGQQASAVVDLDRGTWTDVNDGDPTVFVGRGNKTVSFQDSRHAYPIRGAYAGARRTFQMPIDLHQKGVRMHNMGVRQGQYFINERGY